jgi:plastocyanin
MKIFFTSLLLVVFCNTKAAIHVITVEDNEFTPSNLAINLGDTVMWTWDNASNTHTTTSTTIPSNATSWFYTIDASHPVFMIVPDVSGTYNYECYYHGSMGMVGQFTVNDPLSVGHVDASHIIRLRSSRVTDYLTVEMPELQQDVIPIVRDLTGKVVQTFDAIAPGTTTLYIGTLKNGIYLLELSSSTMRISYRFIKY